MSKDKENKMSSEEVEDVEQMRYALSAIADEVQKFYNETYFSNEANEKMLHEDNLRTALIQCKSTLKLKQQKIKILREHLKTACLVAKSLSAAKESETASLNNQVNNMRSEYWALMKQEKEKNKLIFALQADNEIIRDRLQYLNNFIQLGYQGLQNVQNEKLENTSSLKQLQQIIYFCGQYYADYCNQSEKCTQLEQKNRFLNSKLRILESYLDITSNEFQNLSGKRVEFLEKSLPLSKSKHYNNNICAVYSESRIGHYSNMNSSEMETKKPSENVDLNSHLSTVRKLLHDQDTLLKDLKCLSKEINVELNMEK